MEDSPNTQQEMDIPDEGKARVRQWCDELMKERHVGFLQTLETALHSFGPGERLVLYVLSAILGLSALMLAFGVNALASVTVPVRGGSLVEGEVGPVRFINPLLTLSQADQDLTALVYSGLMRAQPDGTLVPDLAESYTISQDGTVYTFHLRPDATFQDGSKVTSADVLFTIQEAVDPDINSVHRADWTGVSVSAPDSETIVFTLPHAYAPFLYDTTLGILPKALWENVSAEEFPFSPLNTHPIGSGPYKVTNVGTDSTGAASRYDLVPFENYALGQAYLSRISFVFYPDDESLINALNAGQIDAVAALAPADLTSVKRTDLSLAEVPLPRVFGIFFDQSHNTLLTDSGVRTALDEVVDTKQLVDAVLLGRGQVLSGPIPPGTLGGSAPVVPQPFVAPAQSASSSPSTSLIDEARATLQNDGWTWNAASATSTASGTWTKDKATLALTIATADQSDLVATAQNVAADWRSLGVQVSVQVYPLSELNTNILRPRDYDALLFGEVVGPELDLYAFWHSSQRNDPGLNLALYANPNTDTLLSQARATTDTTERDQLYQQFAADLESDHPAVFLYAPDFLYLVPKDLSGIELGALSSPADRFENVNEWYTDTENVWSVFAPTGALQTHS